MKNMGMENVKRKLFPGARYDRLHEEDNYAEDARRRIGDWLLSSSKSQR